MKLISIAATLPHGPKTTFKDEKKLIEINNERQHQRLKEEET